MDYDTLNIEIKIIIADDHEVVRSGLRKLLILDKNIKILDEAQNGSDAVSIVRYHRPDIALLDIHMPKMDGIEATNVIKNEFPEILVVILTAFEDSKHLEKALNAGADGYLTKDISAKQLVDSLRLVMRGERVFTPSIIKMLQKKYDVVPDNEPLITITKREQVILNLVSQGKTSPEIADILDISFRTVQAHRQNLMQKLGVNNSAALINYALKNKLN